MVAAMLLSSKDWFASLLSTAPVLEASVSGAGGAIFPEEGGGSAETDSMLCFCKKGLINEKPCRCGRVTDPDLGILEVVKVGRDHHVW